MFYVSGSGKGVDGVKGTLVWHFSSCFWVGMNFFLIFFFFGKTGDLQVTHLRPFLLYWRKVFFGSFFWTLFWNYAMDLFSFGPFLFWWIPNYDLPFVRETYKLKDILFLTFVWPVDGFLVLLNSGWECSLMIQGGVGGRSELYIGVL